jgi:hypothetical protein
MVGMIENHVAPGRVKPYLGRWRRLPRKRKACNTRNSTHDQKYSGKYLFGCTEHNIYSLHADDVSKGRILKMMA